MAQPKKSINEQESIQELQKLYVDLIYKQKEIAEVPIKYSKQYATIESTTRALKEAKLKLDLSFRAKNKELREYFEQKKETLSKNSKSIFTSQKRKEEIELELSSINTTLDSLDKMADDMIKLGSVRPRRVLRSVPVELGTSRNEGQLSPSEEKMVRETGELRARRAALQGSDLDEAVKKPQHIQKSDSQKSPREQQEVIKGRRAEIATGGGNLIPSELEQTTTSKPKKVRFADENKIKFFNPSEPLIPELPKSLPFAEAIKIGAKLKPTIIESELPEPPRNTPSAEKTVIPPKPPSSPSLLGQIQQGVNLRKPKAEEIPEKPQAAEVKEEPKKPNLFEEMANKRANLKVVPEEEKKDKSAPVIERPPSPQGLFQDDKINKMFEQRERPQQKFTKQPSGVDDSEWDEDEKDNLKQSVKQLQNSGMVTGAGSISSPPTTPKVLSPQKGGGKGRF